MTLPEVNGKILDVSDWASAQNLDGNLMHYKVTSQFPNSLVQVRTRRSKGNFFCYYNRR